MSESHSTESAVTEHGAEHPAVTDDIASIESGVSSLPMPMSTITDDDNERKLAHPTALVTHCVDDALDGEEGEPGESPPPEGVSPHDTQPDSAPLASAPSPSPAPESLRIGTPVPIIIVSRPGSALLLGDTGELALALPPLPAIPNSSSSMSSISYSSDDEKLSTPLHQKFGTHRSLAESFNSAHSSELNALNQSGIVSDDGEEEKVFNVRYSTDEINVLNVANGSTDTNGIEAPVNASYQYDNDSDDDADIAGDSGTLVINDGTMVTHADNATLLIGSTDDTGTMIIDGTTVFDGSPSNTMGGLGTMMLDDATDSHPIRISVDSNGNFTDDGDRRFSYGPTLSESVGYDSVATPIPSAAQSPMVPVIGASLPLTLTPLRLSQGDAAASLSGSMTPLNGEAVMDYSFHPPAGGQHYQATLQSVSYSHSNGQIRAVSPAVDSVYSVYSPYHHRQQSFIYQTAQSPLPINEIDEVKEGETDYTEDEPGMEAAIAISHQDHLSPNDAAVVYVGDEGQPSPHSPMVLVPSSEIELIRAGSGLVAEKEVEGSYYLNAGKEGQADKRVHRQSSLKQPLGNSKNKKPTVAENKAREQRSRSRQQSDIDKKYIPFLSIALLSAHLIMFIVMAAYNGWSMAGISDNPMYGPNVKTMIHYGAKFTPRIVNGESWRLLASLVLNAGVIQLVFSLLILVFFGLRFERIYGGHRMFPIWLVGGIFGQLLSSLMAPRYVDVGGSSALFALIAVWIGDCVHTWSQMRGRWLYLGRSLISSIICFILFVFPFIGGWAELGSFIAGVLLSMALLAPLALVKRGFRDITLPIVLCSVLMLSALIAVVSTLLYNTNEQDLYGDWCSGCKWISCIDIGVWQCDGGVPQSCFNGDTSNPKNAGYC